MDLQKRESYREKVRVRLVLKREREREGHESWLRFAEGGAGSRAKIDREDNVMGRSTKEEIL